MVDAILRKRNTPFWNVPRVLDEVRKVRKCSDVSMKVSDMTSSLKFCMSEVPQKQLLFHWLIKHQQHQGYVEWLSPGVKHRVGVHGRGAERWLSRTVWGHSEAPLLGPSWGTICGNRLIWDTFYSALNLHVFSTEWMSKQEDSQLLKWGILAADKQTLAEL